MRSFISKTPPIPFFFSEKYDINFHYKKKISKSSAAFWKPLKNNSRNMKSTLTLAHSLKISDGTYFFITDTNHQMIDNRYSRYFQETYVPSRYNIQINFVKLKNKKNFNGILILIRLFLQVSFLLWIWIFTCSNLNEGHLKASLLKIWCWNGKVLYWKCQLISDVFGSREKDYDLEDLIIEFCAWW